MDKSYYIEYYDLERKHWWFQVREQIILDQIRNRFGLSKQPFKILNVGIATGRTTEVLMQFGEVTSIEYDKECCTFTRERTGLDVQEGSILELQFNDNSFDLVCSFDVVEHVQDDALAVRELKRVCKPGGVVFITVPALMSLWGKHDEVNHHFKRYKIEEIDTLFGNTDVTLLKRSYFNSILFVPIWIVRVLSRTFPSLFARNKSGSDFTLLKQDSLISKFFYKLFYLEKKWLETRSFFVGVSVLYAVRKK